MVKRIVESNIVETQPSKKLRGDRLVVESNDGCV